MHRVDVSLHSSQQTTAHSDDGSRSPHEAPAARHVPASRPTARRLGGVIVDDRTLLAQMRAGEENAIALLFERYYDALCAFASGYTESKAEAEEVVEDVFLRLWESRAQIEIRDNVKAYLYAATRNRALNQSRHERAMRHRIESAYETDEVPGMGESLPAIEEELHAANFARAVEVAVQQLPPRCREVFLLHRQHELTYAEIGAALEISPRTVENHLARALRHLRTDLAHFLGE